MGVSSLLEFSYKPPSVQRPHSAVHPIATNYNSHVTRLPDNGSQETGLEYSRKPAGVSPLWRGKCVCFSWRVSGRVVRVIAIFGISA